MYNETNHMDGDAKEVQEGEVIEADEADLIPPPIIKLGDKSQKRSSGRVTMPSSRLHGYELYCLRSTSAPLIRYSEYNVIVTPP
jgi:hypothetical protein